MEIVNLDDEILKKTLTNKYRSGFVTIDGFVFPNSMTSFTDRIKNLEVHDTDVWVTTFPKCGTTWTQEMVWLIGNNFDYKSALVMKLEERFPFLESSGLFDTSSVDNHSIDSIQRVETLKKPRFIKTHLPWDLLPQQITSRAKKPKIIHVVRNPKDVCVSYYHHMKLFEGYTGTFEEFSEMFVTDKIIYGPFWKNISTYWRYRDEPNCLFLKYEDMKKNLPSVITEVAKFLGKTISDEQIEILSEHLNFENMKNNEAVNKQHIIKEFKMMNLNVSGDAFIRSGKINNYKAYMKDDTIRKFDEWSSLNLNDLFN